ncbi:uncharacterized protein BP01DRAFT_359544 [Aspergillus saccharolyticus JOP 1030-1]|uniref:Knr4/Smi1-like domain-containing protein n=1 Tax=Aspergillus saccharolyticus JOP 1030-1 TaxID=1450539 RepID=A0A318Z4N3_9EURO|nr:hypothetical protein BP01DRAFT_359544 [Aspergillus saccharolyticus JOP 1030-1]PYH42275.1 hypothetical protein BP01DRAFT_359544 [Aspergillus saccharolyticus JOP 1030-1]
MLATILTLLIMSLSIPLWQRYQPHSPSSNPSTDSITPQQKARLHEIADLMSEIYETLVAMRYLDPSGIQRGPHNLTALASHFTTLNIDPAVQYLYSILPYIDPAAAGHSGFLHGGEFTDFRDAERVEQGRDPFYALYGVETVPDYDSEDGAYMRPWVTPLSQLGNHGSVILYDARRHLIWMIDQEGWSTTDLALRDVEEREPVSVNRNSFEHIPHRDAGEVLRDVVRWYRALDEVPTGGESDGWDEWSALGDDGSLRELYLKHGWPDAFDGDAFEVDVARAMARMQAEEFATEPLRVAQEHRKSAERVDSWLARVRDQLREGVQTDEEKWGARWEIVRAMAQAAHANELVQLAEHRVRDLCPGNVCLQPQGRPLWELQYLHQEVEEQETRLAELDEQLSEAPSEQPVLDDDREQRNKERGLLMRKLAVYRTAYEAARLEAEQQCPGQTFQSMTGLERLQWPAWRIEYPGQRANALQLLQDARELLAQVPDDLQRVRAQISDFIRWQEAMVGNSEETD